VSQENRIDPRDVLARDKYFTLRPRPLEQWLWRAGVPASAERVFWLHWQEGMRSDWCSEIPLKRVATLCALDVSTVTRAYQLLGKLGLIRRQDPGRDPQRPFEQAVAITEVWIPRELLQELGRHPNRTRRETTASTNETVPEAKTVPNPEMESSRGAQKPADPLAGLGGRDRMKAISALLDRMSAGERRQYEEALRTRKTTLVFDDATQLLPDQRATVLQLLTTLATNPPVEAKAPPMTTVPKADSTLPRLSPFEIARLRRDIQDATSQTEVTELLRQVVWSIQHGALTRFTTLHATRIALKKIRLGQWSRPHRMPPQWSRQLTQFSVSSGFNGTAGIEQCSVA
jgi:hypothetical protein